ncbi:MAG: ParB/RepB/Spo0J family partition protein [Bacteroidaceae bacterium]|nr:ParB/RepB/Spo0J family partition protein [Bacteroidaceae bacterium]MBR6846091.1 ParB/RepB/Spo0J family partition protein [Bacteroidaceae bacterium]MCR5334712.1 ParB/RepB/Spo0J family partition protein [Bacteroidaceae bacterium]
MTIKKKYTTLGRGLDALIGAENVSPAGSGSINEIPVDKIMANPNQPRRDFDEETLAELSASIRELGIVQPITLRDKGDGTYLIIAGERRWRASQMAGLETIPAYVRTVDDENMMAMALIENIQREDLNAMEIALAYQNLMEQYKLTQERLSERVGKNRSTVTNYLRLLKLPATIQLALKRRELEMGHARALLSLNSAKQQLDLYEEIKNRGLSVRAVEQAVHDLRNGSRSNNDIASQKKNSKLAQEYNILRDSLSRFFRTKVQLSCSDNGKGKITIPFANEAEMIRIIELLDRLK